MQELLATLPRPTLLVLRYLFSFLNHLSEFADENCMDPYNLAICFGPTLMPIPDGKDQVWIEARPPHPRNQILPTPLDWGRRENDLIERGPHTLNLKEEILVLDSWLSALSLPHPRMLHRNAFISQTQRMYLGNL